MITCADCEGITESSVIRFFSNTEVAGFYEWCDGSAEKDLERLVFQVSKESSCLEAHMERIYYCFQNYLDEQLFGALVDLLVVLKRNGQALGKRMVIGSKSRLTENQFQVLTNHLDSKSSSMDLLPGSRYSVFTKGLWSATALLQLNENSNEEEYDPLALARDYVEFSQIDNAIHILEQAILVQPERMELHNELLLLFRSIRDEIRFNRTFEELSRKRLILPPEWKQLHDFFVGLNNDGK
ncbi:FimV family protein [Methyloglobulus sp.]|uniref:type IV pilus assembly protein FimV n=1 Tax=Methyloglobulus sp. TaxID=2518622 RepID=UPI003989F598